jgi:hypothetical protein
MQVGVKGFLLSPETQLVKILNLLSLVLSMKPITLAFHQSITLTADRNNNRKSGGFPANVLNWKIFPLVMKLELMS